MTHAQSEQRGVRAGRAFAFARLKEIKHFRLRYVAPALQFIRPYFLTLICIALQESVEPGSVELLVLQVY